MRTSVDIPDPLMKKAKIRAIEEEISLKELIIRSLENELKEEKSPTGTPWKNLRGKGSVAKLRANTSGFSTS